MADQTKDISGPGSTGKDLFIGHYEARKADGPAWLNEARAAAIQQFAHLDLPSARDEAWRQTNINAVRKTAYAAPARGGEGAQALIEAHGFDKLDAIRLVFVNGFYDTQLSSIGAPEGVTITTLATAIKADVSFARTLLGKCADGQDHAFISLNTALFEDGAYIELPAGLTVEKPVHLLFVTLPALASAIATHPRNLIVIGKGARLTLLESYIGAAGTNYLTNAVTEIFVDDEAHVEHVKLQDESLAATHIAAIQSRLGRAANYANHAISSGALLGRNEIGAFLDGENIECKLNGLYMADGKQHLDTHTRLDHAKPNCNSVEIYKGILDGESSSVFTGKIFVHPQAQKTDAIQRNGVLLLSDNATADTQPQLEIFADDVKCTHGATIGELDEEAAFYLRSRGISKDHARGILTYAFANDIVDQLPIPVVRDHLEALLARKYRH